MKGRTGLDGRVYLFVANGSRVIRPSTQRMSRHDIHEPWHGMAWHCSMIMTTTTAQSIPPAFFYQDANCIMSYVSASRPHTTRTSQKMARQDQTAPSPHGG